MRKAKQLPLLELPWPAEIDTPEVHAALHEYFEYRKERKLAPYTVMGFRSLLSKLRKWGPERVIAAIAHSISSNYQGIYEERTVSHPPTQPEFTTNRKRNLDQLKQRIER